MYGLSRSYTSLSLVASSLTIQLSTCISIRHKYRKKKSKKIQVNKAIESQNIKDRVSHTCYVSAG